MRRTRLGLGAAAGTAALALLVGGCGSGEAGNGGDDGGTSQGEASGGGKDDGGPDDGGPDGGTSQGEASGGGADTGGSGDGGTGGEPGGGSGGSGPDLAPYQGPWAAGMKSDAGKPMILIFNKAEVSLAGPDIACQGSLKAAEKPAKLAMECQDKGDDYASGTITELGDKSLTVTWGSGEKSEFLKGAAPAGPPGE